MNALKCLSGPRPLLDHLGACPAFMRCGVGMFLGTLAEDLGLGPVHPHLGACQPTLQGCGVGWPALGWSRGRSGHWSAGGKAHGHEQVDLLQSL